MSATSKTASSHLPDIVGAEHVSTDPAELGACAVDGKLPSVTVCPGSTEEVIEVVKYAAAEKLALIASGARTKLGIGSPPARYDVALDMTRLNRIIAYDPGDLTLSVETGTPLRKVAEALAQHRQFLPLAVPYFDRATVGGTIASGVDTPLRQFYGTARDYVLGMEFVLGEGVALEKRWQCGEKCHRIRFAQIDDRLIGHVRGNDPRELQDLSDASGEPRLRCHI